MAIILNHPAHIVRCWMLREEGAGQCSAILHSEAHGIEAETPPGPRRLVLDTLHHQRRHVGAPIAPFTVLPIRKAVGA